MTLQNATVVSQFFNNMLESCFEPMLCLVKLFALPMRNVFALNLVVW